MAEEEMSDFPAEETAPAEDRLNAPLLPGAVALPTYSDALQCQSLHSACVVLL